MQYYFEQRSLPINPPTALAADIARHLQLRQYLGTALVVCDNPIAILSSTRKQWLKSSRNLQRQRASTLNAEEILRLTHAIMHMQNMEFSTKDPAANPAASTYFVTPEQFARVPTNCYSVYVITPISAQQCKKIKAKLPQGALFIDYTMQLDLLKQGLYPKTLLEKQVMLEWDSLRSFLKHRGIDPAKLVVNGNLQLVAMDDALDTLLGISSEFLRQSANFQHVINLSQPLTMSTKAQQKTFEAVTRLAHRVQAMSPGTFHNYLVNTFGDRSADLYFLRATRSYLYDDLERAELCVMH